MAFNAQQSQAIQGKAQAVGLDWSKLSDFIRNLNWLEVVQFVRTIISIFSSNAPGPSIQGGAPNKAGQPAPHDHVESAKAHFDAIAELSECGKRCLGG